MYLNAHILEQLAAERRKDDSRRAKQAGLAEYAIGSVSNKRGWWDVLAGTAFFIPRVIR